MIIIITKNVEAFAAGSEIVGQSVVRNHSMLIRCTRNKDILMIQLLQSVVVFVAVVGIA